MLHAIIWFIDLNIEKFTFRTNLFSKNKHDIIFFTKLCLMHIYNLIWENELLLYSPENIAKLSSLQGLVKTS